MEQTASSPAGAHHNSEDRGIALLRVAIAILLGIHGVARISLGIVGAFGGFLSLMGLPAGHAMAWAITIFEIVGALALILRRFVVPVAALFIIELAVGIALVHAKEGWFVVGAGRNGVEFSVLLIAALSAIIISQRARRRMDS